MNKTECYINNNENFIYHRENIIFASNKPSDRIYSTVEEIRTLIFKENCTIFINGYKNRKIYSLTKIDQNTSLICAQI